MTNWNFNPDFQDDNTVRWQLDTDAIFAEVRDKMMDTEEEAYTQAVIAVLKEKGYGVWKMPTPEKVAEIEAGWKKWDERFDDE